MRTFIVDRYVEPWFLVVDLHRIGSVADIYICLYHDKYTACGIRKRVYEEDGCIERSDRGHVWPGR